ncbi:HK97-gp10 family putative phage morphogenesis protein [Bacillus sp. REN10]|uniref:HK97-gp10 family putative phage morphogenesis protein n=1 Tax=Bacillus sp. REN10 TaxID=2782541 RepID=UPI00193C655E|nr:HK97-gp10 family putative phage morphogenesis protein [Bacillus sp. REN10]
MANIKFGSKRLSAALHRYGQAVEKEIKRIVVETAKIIESNAKALAPVDDGNLKQSIETEVTNGGLTAVVTVGAHYAIYVEFGTGIYATGGDGRKTPWIYWSDKLGRFVYTRGQKPQEFWGPAVDIGRRYFQTEMRKLG